MTVGTDFLTFATGSGTNLEDQPSYLSDPLRQTGNLPGIARSNFNNKAMRQGTFVACAISTFVTQQLDVFVPDDGDVQKYVDYFKQAISALLLGGLPGEPDLSLYVRKAGDTMTGDLQFIPGASIQLSHNTWMRAKNTAGVPLNVLIMSATNNIHISDGSSAYTFFGNTPVVGNARYWACQDTGGAVRGVLGIGGDNNTYIQSYNSLYINSSNIWANSNILIPNGNWYYGKNTAGAPAHLLGVDGNNNTLIGPGAPLDTYIYAASGRTVYIQNGVQIAGGLTIPYLRNNGSSDFMGGVTMHSSLGVHGGSNFYSHLNVNNGAGATISGQLDTNTLHCIGAHAYVDGNIYAWDIYAGGSLFAGGLQAYNNGGWFYFVNNINTNYLHSRSDIVCPGTVQGGYINSNGNMRTAGQFNCDTIYTNYCRSWGAIEANNFHAFGHLQSANTLGVSGRMDVGGEGHINGGTHISNGLWISGLTTFYSDILLHQHGRPNSHGGSYWGTCSNAWYAMYAFYFVTLSDASLKRDIRPIPTDCLDLVTAIEPKTYKLKNIPLDDHGRPGRDDTHWGFIHGEVAEVMRDRDFGGEFEDMGYGLLMYNELTTVLWQAVRELAAKVKKLESAASA